MTDLYLVTRTDRCDYDEYDGVVVAANSEDEALEFVTTVYPDPGWRSRPRFEGMYPGNTVAKKIENFRPGDVILSSFRAG